MDTIKPRMAAARRYPEELCERAIRPAVDARKDPARRPGGLARIGGKLGINPETLWNWVTQAEIDAGCRPGTTTPEAERLRELEREVKERRRTIAIVKSASAFFAAELARPSRVSSTTSTSTGPSRVEPICTMLTSADTKIAPSTWFNHRRLHGEIGLVPPVDHENTDPGTTPAQQPAERDVEVSVSAGTRQARTCRRCAGSGPRGPC